jgi:hypothetical protein
VVEHVLRLLALREQERDRKAKYRDKMADVPQVSRGTDAGKTLQEQEQEQVKKNPATQDSPVAIANGTPYEAIRELWIEILPNLTRPMPVAYWTEARKVQVRNRWKDQLPTLDAWRKCFERIKASPFLMGKTAGRDGRPFKCDLFWITKPENLLKLYEGKYHA